ncbi:3'(2'),5'-bisphosphate nucleotidase CysQ [Carboxylicivirga taeanensis]|uniref:3'(2'),5'-bisphosphate nucleotidase CysQ n=1 Tax=Carboxylicivirga taeanensis TaxID=1416875 RepID=UPI003F6DCE83
MHDLTQLALKASVRAGKEILEVFNSDDFGLRLKSDDSPLTEADLKSHQIIEEYLKETDIPVLSEEGEMQDYQERKCWSKLWVVDPLDGTKEFIKRSGEFTVNVALVDQQRPTMGVVFAPVLGSLYWGDESGAFKAQLPSDWYNIELNELCAQIVGEPLPSIHNANFTVLASVSHQSKETEELITALEAKVGNVNVASRGSSLKMCLVAEGSAHLYPRLAPTMEWDTAAGQAVVEAAGGGLFDWQTKQPMLYNRKELLNNWFIAVGKGLDVNDYWLC